MMRFNYGDSVRLRSSDLASRYGLQTGSVCGFREITSSEIARQFGVSVGTVLVLVEGGNGVAVEIPEDFLDKI